MLVQKGHHKDAGVPRPRLGRKMKKRRKRKGMRARIQGHPPPIGDSVRSQSEEGRTERAAPLFGLPQTGQVARSQTSKRR